MRVALLYGGFSQEREVSIRSGEAVMAALKKLGHKVIAMDVKEPTLPPLMGVDVVFIALHGVFGEDGTLQALLDEEGVPYIGSGAEASRRAWDKLLAKSIFEKRGIFTPPYQIVEEPMEFERICKIPLPWMVKPARQGSTIGTSFVETGTDFLSAYKKAKEYDGKVFVESYIEGKELTVGILGEDALPIVQILPRERRFFDYHSKYTEGATFYLVPAPLPPNLYQKVQQEALKAFESLGCEGFGRVDLILKDEDVFILEVNTIPGLTRLSLLPKAALAAGMEFEELVEKIMRLALR